MWDVGGGFDGTVVLSLRHFWRNYLNRQLIPLGRKDPEGLGRR